MAVVAVLVDSADLVVRTELLRPVLVELLGAVLAAMDQAVAVMEHLAVVAD